MLKRITAGLLPLVFMSGCGAIAADMQKKGSTTFYGPIGSSGLSKLVVDEQQKRVAYGLFVRSKNYPPFELLKPTNPVGIPLSIVNLFIPLPSVQMAEFISVYMKGLTNEDIEKIATALRKDSEMKWNEQQVVNEQIYFWSKKHGISFSVTKSSSEGKKDYYMVIEGLHGREILDLVVKKLNLSLSEDYRNTYKTALSGITPDVTGAYTYQDIFPGW